LIAFHGIISAYGFWLPNDPRGSWSTWVGAWELFRYGPARKVSTRRSVAGRTHDRQRRYEAKRALKHEPARFTGAQARAVAQGFGQVAYDSGYTIHALAVMPEHLHVVAAARDRDPGQIIGHLKRGATDRLIADGIHPFDHGAERIERSCWSDRAWKVYLDNIRDARRAIAYVEDNPRKEGLRRQRWSFVTPFGKG
jgi:REP element-mobilizing transposase RayT